VDHSLTNLTIRLDPSAALVSKVNIAMKFFITVVTASRMTSYLKLNFGAGTEKRYFLWDEGGDMIGAPPSGGDFIRLLASYDSACLLSVEVDHVFQKQGVFPISAECFNNHSRITGYLGHMVTILRELQGASLLTRSVVKKNDQMDIRAILVSASVNMTYSWRITNADRSFQKNLTTSDPILTYVFIKTGLYTITLVVSNLLGSVSTSGLINVQDLITGLSVSSSQQFIRANHPVNCLAAVATGSDVKFTWTWDDGSRPDLVSVSGRTAEISHTFTKVGRYNVSVRAENLLIHMTVYILITVQEGVTHLMLSSLGPVALGNTSTVIARSSTGTDVLFDVNFGNARKRASGTRYGADLHITHVFTGGGTHTVTVFAYNKVSEVNQKIVLVVEELVQHVTILTTNTLVINETAIIVAKTNGRLIL
jgi:PKD repeat protein